MMTERDDPFLDLGYTSAEDAEELRDRRLKKQKIDQVTAAQKRQSQPRPTGNVRGFHDGELRLGEEFPSDGKPLTPEQRDTNQRGIELMNKIRARIALDNVINSTHDESYIDPDNRQASEEEEERMLNARLRKHFDTHPRRQSPPSE